MDLDQDWVMNRMAISSQQPAIIDIHSGAIWTYAKLENRMMHWIAYFSTKGYAKGERIAVVAPNSAELFAILFACVRKGLIYVPLNWRLSGGELTVLLQDCQPAILLYHEQFSPLIRQTGFPEAIALHSIKTVLSEDVASESDFVSISGDDPWMILYTGGTTGAPKGVVLSINAVQWNALNTVTSWGLTEADRTVNYMPLFHTGGLNALCIPILLAGGTVIIGNNFDAEEALMATNRYKATISLFVPTMYQAMIQTPYFEKSSFPSMNAFLSGGAPCPKTIYQSFRDKELPFKEGYGLTEAGPNNFFIQPTDAMRKMGSIGKSMLFNHVKVVAEEGGIPCQSGEVGELFLKGPHLFSSYWGKPEETAATMDGEWLRTGDLARRDTEGDYFIVGRKKDMIITGGENVYPQEVEQCLILYGEVCEAAVIGENNDVWGETVVAYITVRKDHEFILEDLIDHCRKHLGSYKIPKKVTVLEELPKTHVGKIDKKALQMMCQT